MFPKIMVPQIIHFNRVFHYKPSIWGYPYFWKHPSRVNNNQAFTTTCNSYDVVFSPPNPGLSFFRQILANLWDCPFLYPYPPPPKKSDSLKVTLPETNSLPLKMDGWNTSFLLGNPIFRGYVSFREGKPFNRKPSSLA